MSVAEATRTKVTGWHITGTGNLRGWRAVEIGVGGQGWSARHFCDACGERHGRTVAKIHSSERQFLQLMACNKCGSVQYGHFPERQWLDEFYAADWDASGNAAVPNYAENSCTESLYLAQMHGLVKKGRTGLDVGCGFGQDMLAMKRHGMDACGIEPSTHRAATAIERTKCVVLSGDADRVELLIQPDLITCHEVLEHVYDPQATVAKFAEWQKPGGYVVASVPNIIGEPTLGVLLFLPHLRSFSTLGICELFRRNGYGINGLHVTAGNTIVIAQRGSSTDIGPRTHTFDVRKKFRDGLGLNRNDRTSLRWPFDQDHLIDGAGPNVRELFVEPIESDGEDIPTLRWNGPLQLMVK